MSAPCPARELLPAARTGVRQIGEVILSRQAECRASAWLSAERSIGVQDCG